MGCGWWPCCGGETFNLRRYDQDRNVLWSTTALNGNHIQCLAIQADGDYLYVGGYSHNVNTEAVLAKYDITGAVPVLEWSIPQSFFRAHSASFTGFKSLKVDSSGDLICLTSSSSGVSGLPGLHVYKFTSSGVETWRRKLTISAGAFNPQARGNDMCVDSSGGIYVGLTFPLFFGDPGANSPSAYKNLIKLNSDSSTAWEALSEPSLSGVGNHTAWTIRAVTTDNTRLFWGCLGSGASTYSGFRTVGASLCATGAATWSGATQVTGVDVTNVIALEYADTLGQVWAGRIATAPLKAYTASTGVFVRNANSILTVHPLALDSHRDANETAPDDVKLFRIAGSSTSPQRWTWNNSGTESLDGAYEWHDLLPLCIKSYYPATPLAGYSTIIGGQMGSL